MMIRPTTLTRGLPKDTSSICPECGKVIPARIIERGGKAVMEKNCPEHGPFSDVVWSDARMYLQAEQYAVDGIGVENPFITKENPVCPEDCGLCKIHLTHTVLANLDLTNRCNLTCPVCFANANASGYVFEPSFDEVHKMMQILRAQRPLPCSAIQFAGGEPTIHPDFLKIVRDAAELGFAQIQVATNGIKMAESMEFTQACRDAGLHTVYLQFDGMSDDIYRKTRGCEMLEIKKKAVENIRATKGRKMTVCLVPTVIKGVNDHDIGNIVRYAIDNIDIVHAVNFQPVAFSGRISKKELEKQRFTLPDLAIALKEQLGIIEPEDFYTVPAMSYLSELISLIKNKPRITFSAHPHCGIGTFVFVEKKDKTNIVPITRFVRVKELLADVAKLASELETKKASFITRTKEAIKFYQNLEKKYVIKEKVPEGLDIIKLLKPLFASGDKKALSKFTWNALMIGGMHFQDAYNYDIERVRRCCIHYVVPDGRIIPFCAYNSGPIYRTEIESKFSVPVKVWLERNPGRTVVEPCSFVKRKK
ncbi:MAG: radical SAM protein [Thermoplasmata archaeon]